MLYTAGAPQKVKVGLKLCKLQKIHVQLHRITGEIRGVLPVLNLACRPARWRCAVRWAVQGHLHNALPGALSHPLTYPIIRDQLVKFRLVPKPVLQSKKHCPTVLESCLLHTMRIGHAHSAGAGIVEQACTAHLLQPQRCMLVGLYPGVVFVSGISWKVSSMNGTAQLGKSADQRLYASCKHQTLGTRYAFLLCGNDVQDVDQLPHLHWQRTKLVAISHRPPSLPVLIPRERLCPAQCPLPQPA